MFDFIRLQLKLKWGWNKNNSKKNAIMTAVASFLAVAIALALVWGLSFVLKASISVSAKRLSVLYLTILMIGLTVVATSMQINRLYHPKDLNISARFPLSPFKIFVCSLILNYIDLCIYSAILLLPIMLVFGWAMNCITFAFVCGIILGIIFFPLIPFGLSILIAIPIMYISSLLQKHNIVRLIVFIVFLAGLFALYYYILTILAQFFIHRNWEEGTLGIWKSILTGLDSFYNPAYYLGNIIFFEKFWLGFGAMLGASVVLIAGGIAIARLVYGKIRTKELESGNTGIKKETKIDDFSSTRAILKHSFTEILHTKTYSYFYLGVAISTPVMVFLCNRLVEIFGEAQIGAGINFGVSILVVAVFMAMIGSFAATILSIEGKNFYITKLVPVSYRKQLLIKGLINIAVSLGALLLSSIVLISLQFIDGIELVVIFISQAIFVIGLVFNGINLNLINPNLKPKANGEAEEINVTYMLMIGLAISAIFGLVSLLLPKIFVSGKVFAYIIVIGLGLIYAVVNFVVFWFTVNKKYRKIEV